MSEHWAILGGGMLGMTLAHRLAPLGHELSLFEASQEWGGLAAAWTVDGVVWDRFYHVTLSSDAHLRWLLSDLGLETELRWKRTRTGFYTGVGSYPMSSALDFLRLPAVGPVAKLRLAATLWMTSRRTDWKALENLTLEEYLRRWSGGRVFEEIWLPLLRAKLGDNYRQASAAFIWAVIRRLMEARRSGLKEELFGYVSGGYRRILSRLAEVLTSRDVRLNLGHAAARIRGLARGKLLVEFENGRVGEFDRVIATIPSPAVANICPELAGEEREAFRRVRYQGLVCASVLLRRPLTDYYLSYITDPGIPFTGVVEMSNLVHRAEFGGGVLVYLPKYLPSDDDLFEWSDEELRELLLGSLEKMHPGLRREEILAFRVARSRSVFALPVVGYSRLLPSMRTSVQGLHVVNSSYIVNGTLNVNETVGIARQYAATC